MTGLGLEIANISASTQVKRADPGGTLLLATISDRSFFLLSLVYAVVALLLSLGCRCCCRYLPICRRQPRSSAFSGGGSTRCFSDQVLYDFSCIVLTFGGFSFYLRLLVFPTYCLTFCGDSRRNHLLRKAGCW